MTTDSGVIRSLSLGGALQHIEILTAAYRRHVFARHSHETVAIGVINRGRGSFWCRGQVHLAYTGQVVVIPAGEVHTGASASDATLRYTMLYVPTDMITSPDFPRPVVTDVRLAHALLAVTSRIARNEDRLGIESALAHVVSLLESHGGVARTCLDEPVAIRRVRAYIEERLAQPISLDDLALVAELNPEYLIRTFHRAVGLPPHAYLVQMRIERARRLLSAGVPPAGVAAAVGFVDQSHLTRQFKRHLGTTPARYQECTRQGSTSRAGYEPWNAISDGPRRRCGGSRDGRT